MKILANFLSIFEFIVQVDVGNKRIGWC